MDEPSDRQQKDLVREQFTRTAEVFGDFAVATRGGDAELLARLVQASGEDLAVDLACGPGSLALRFARHVRWICGLDLTPAILERARRSAAEEQLVNIDFAIGDAHSLPLADGSLDIAITSYSLHHMSDPAEVIREMARVVKPGGRVGVIDIRASENPKVTEMSTRIERLRDASHTRALPKSETEAIFRASGLRVIADETEEKLRPFDHWMHVAGWTPGDQQYVEARRLLESTMADDSADFPPRFIPGGLAEHSNQRTIQIVNTILFIAAEKT